MTPEESLVEFLEAALAAGVPEGDVAALRGLARLDRAADDPDAAWFLAVRRVLDQPVAEAAVLLGGALIFSSVGEGAPWRVGHPFGRLEEARWFSAGGADRAASLKLRIAGGAHVLEQKPDDAYATSLRGFADALLDRLERA